MNGAAVIVDTGLRIQASGMSCDFAVVRCLSCHSDGQFVPEADIVGKSRYRSTKCQACGKSFPVVPLSSMHRHSGMSPDDRDMTVDCFQLLSLYAQQAEIEMERMP